MPPIPRTARPGNRVVNKLTVPCTTLCAAPLRPVAAPLRSLVRRVAQSERGVVAMLVAARVRLLLRSCGPLPRPLRSRCCCVAAPLRRLERWPLHVRQPQPQTPLVACDAATFSTPTCSCPISKIHTRGAFGAAYSCPSHASSPAPAAPLDGLPHDLEPDTRHRADMQKHQRFQPSRTTSAKHRSHVVDRASAASRWHSLHSQAPDAASDGNALVCMAFSSISAATAHAPARRTSQCQRGVTRRSRNTNSTPADGWRSTAKARLTGSAPAGAKRSFRQRSRYSELHGSGNEAEGGSLRHWSSHLCINLHGLSGQMSACLERFQWLAPFRDGLAGRLHTSFLASSRPPSQCDGVGIEESLSTQSSARVRILVTKRKKVFEGYGASRMS